jgi:Tol biopolymer transport system component
MRRFVFWIAYVSVLSATALTFASAAQAAFPGANGKIAFGSIYGDIFVINPDGTGETQLADPGYVGPPKWSPDGRRIVFVEDRSPCGEHPGYYCMDIWRANADGSNPVNLTNVGNGFSYYLSVSWSPDGSKILYTSYSDSGDAAISTMNADGSNKVQITPETTSVNPGSSRWSPDGARIAFDRNIDPSTETREIFVMKADGSNVQQLTFGSAYPGAQRPVWAPDGKSIAFDLQVGLQVDVYAMLSDGSGKTRLTNNGQSYAPAWSPDGRKISFSSAPSGGNSDIYVMNSDGTAQVNLTNTARPENASDWQPLGALDPYPRPGSGTPVRVPLVPAYQQCTATNSSHVAPLNVASCSPPRTASSQLAMRAEGYGSGFARYVAVPGDPSTVADEADVRITAVTSDVRTKAGADYTGKVILRTTIRLTDTRNGFGALPGTVQTFGLDALAACVPTLSPVGGSVCSLDTTADALVPGLMRENTKAIMSFPGIDVRDVGPDGDVGEASSECPPTCGTGDETVFVREGLFTP